MGIQLRHQVQRRVVEEKVILGVAAVGHVGLPGAPQRRAGGRGELAAIQVCDRRRRVHPEHVAARAVGEQRFEAARAPRRVLMQPQAGGDGGVTRLARTFRMRPGVNHRAEALFGFCGCWCYRVSDQHSKEDSHWEDASSMKRRRLTWAPSSPSRVHVAPLSEETYTPCSWAAANNRPGCAGSNATLVTAALGRPALRSRQVLPLSSEMATPGPQPATAMRFGSDGSKAMSYRLRSTPRRPTFSKVRPQSREANSPPCCVAASQKQASCGDCSMRRTWKPAAPARRQVRDRKSTRL